MTPADLDRLEALARAATPGPWRRGADLRAVITDYRDENGNSSADNYVRGGWVKTIFRVHSAAWRPIGQQVSDLDFCAAANPSTVLRLIAECRRKM